jgi:hypothetical protein
MFRAVRDDPRFFQCGWQRGLKREDHGKARSTRFAFLRVPPYLRVSPWPAFAFAFDPFLTAADQKVGGHVIEPVHREEASLVAARAATRNPR